MVSLVSPTTIIFAAFGRPDHKQYNIESNLLCGECKWKHNSLQMSQANAWVRVHLLVFSIVEHQSLIGIAFTAMQIANSVKLPAAETNCR